MDKLLLLGDEAIAQAALDAGSLRRLCLSGHTLNGNNGIHSIFPKIKN